MSIFTQDPTIGQVFSDAPQRIAQNACKVLENADVYNAGTFRKRPGFDALSLTVTTGGLVRDDELHTVAYLGDQLVLFAQGDVFSYRPDLDQWELRGPWTPLNAEAFTLHDTQPDQSHVGVAYVGDYRATVWIDEPTPQQPAYGITYRQGLPSQYIGPSLGTLFGGANDIAVTAHQGETTAVVARVDGTLNFVRLQAIDETGPVGSVESFAITVAAAGGLYDVSVVGDHYYVAFINAVGTFFLVSFDVDAAGIDGASVTTEFTGALGANHAALTMAQLDDGRAFVGYLDSTTPLVYDYAWITPGAGVTHSGTVTPTNGQTMRGLTSVARGDTDVHVAVDYETTSASLNVTHKVELYDHQPSSTTVAVLDSYPATRLIGKGYYNGLSVWFPLLTISGAPQGLVVDSVDAEVIAEFAHNGAIGFEPDVTVPIAQPYAQPAYDAVDGVVEFPHNVRVLRGDGVSEFGFITFGARIPAMLQLTTRTACMFPQQFNDALHWPHPGYLRSYSQGQAFEAGFHGGAPRVISLAPTAGGGLTAGAYLYAYTWAATDAAGRVYRSAPTFSASTSPSGGNLQTTARIFSLPATERDAVNLEIWRTLANQTGPFYLVTSQALPTNAIDQTAVINYVDSLSDAQAVDRPQLDQQPAGGQLPNDSTPVANWCAVAGDRLWCRDLDTPGRVRASKFRVDGVGTEMSPYILVDQPEDAKGEVSRGLAQQDGVFFLLGARTVSVFQGDGPDNTGANGSFSPASLIPAAQGHLLEGGALVTPVGILYVTDEGLGSLGRNQGILDAVPAITAAYRNQGYQIAQIHHEKDRSELWLIDPQVDPADNPRPGLPAPTTLVYSDATNRWSAMSTALRARSIAGNGGDGLVLITAAGAVWRRNLDITTDAGNAYPLRPRTGWMQVGDLSSQPVMWTTLMLTANYLSAHALTIRVRADYDETVRVTYDVDASAEPPGQLQYQVRLDGLNLTANTIDVEIQDDGEGLAWEFIQLTASYEQSAATNNLVVIPARLRFGVATRTAPV